MTGQSPLLDRGHRLPANGQGTPRQGTEGPRRGKRPTPFTTISRRLAVHRGVGTAIGNAAETSVPSPEGRQAPERGCAVRGLCLFREQLRRSFRTNTRGALAWERRPMRCRARRRPLRRPRWPQHRMRRSAVCQPLRGACTWSGAEHAPCSLNKERRAGRPPCLLPPRSPSEVAIRVALVALPDVTLGLDALPRRESLDAAPVGESLGLVHLEPPAACLVYTYLRRLRRVCQAPQ